MQQQQRSAGGPRLSAKVAIVTGAASPRGFGFATARRFAHEGAKVVLTDIVAADVEARAAELRKGGAEAIGLPHDVTSEDAWQTVVQQSLREFGRVDVLVNNAGIAAAGSIDSTSLQAWDRMIAINLTGAFLGCQTVIRQLRAQKSPGSIINISSAAALSPHANNTAYCASKGGVRVLTQTVALDVAAEGIRVNSVHPGLVDTDMMVGAMKADPARVQAIINSIPMRRLGEADDIAAINLFLASDEAQYITGAQLSVDGGRTAK